MSEPLPCSQCGRIIFGKSCPYCLMALALNNPSGDSEETAPIELRSPEASEKFGPYTTLRVLGEGGMGIVYLAEQREPIQRRVALKVIKLGMDSREVIARFESERQALALMDHPNIARVLDAGASASGRPYFVMEYVPGVAVTEYCDRHQLSSRERLEVFCTICRAIQHAHQKGVIHRDIKPSNILVEVLDGKAVPKVIDFGVAKAISQRLTEKTLFTQMGVLIGTPAYMSPEQAGTTEADVDTSTDIYSLGVVLYELLVGSLPFDPAELRRKGYAEICRVIREEEPPKPSTKLESLGATGTEVAKRRHTDVRTLVRQVRGDLEWITMKALDKDRRRRYASVSEFAADIQRHMNDEPVMASPPGVLYRAQKFLRKHRAGVTAVAAIILVSLTGAALSTVEFFNARHQKEVAQWQSYVANIAAADGHIRAGKLASAQQLLLKCEPSLRGWEWRYLWARSDTSIATLYPQAGGRIKSIGFSHDGKQLFLATEDQVEVWSAATFTPIITYVTMRQALTMSPDGTRILTLGKNEGEPLQLMDPSTRVVLFTTPTVSGRAPIATFSNDSTLAAAAVSDGGIHLWNATTGKHMALLAGNRKKVTALRFSAAGKLIAAGSEDGGVRVWDVVSFRLLETAKAKESIAGLEFSPNGAWIAACSKDGSLRVWDVRSARQIAAANGTGPINAIAFSQDGSKLAWGTDVSLQVWAGPSGVRKLDVSLEPNRGVAAVAFTPDSSRILVAGRDGSVELRDAENGKQIELLVGARASAFSAETSGIVTVNPEGNLMLAYTGGDRVRVWKIPVPPVRIGFEGEPSEQWAEWTSSENLIAHVMKNRLYLWQAGSPMPLSGWNGRPGYRMASLSRDGTLLAAVSERSEIVVWNVATGVTVARFSAKGAEISHLRFSGDGSRLATVTKDRTARVWEVKSSRTVMTVPLAVSLSDVTLNEDGSRTVISAGSFSRPTFRFFNTDTGRLLSTADVPRLPVSDVYLFSSDSGRIEFRLGDFDVFPSSIQFSPDGKWIANGEFTRPGAWLRDASTASLVSTLAARDVVWSLSFTPDSQRLATANGASITIWDPSREEALLSIPGCSPQFAIGLDQLVCVSLPEQSAVTVKVSATHSSYYPGAQELVEALLLKHFLVPEVVHVLEQDKTLDRDLRKAAIAEARRHLDDFFGLLGWADITLTELSEGRAQYQLVLERFRAVGPLLQEQAPLYRGMAQYRLGEYTEALALLTRSEEKDRDGMAVVFLAMTEQRLGKHQNALALLAKFKEIVPDGQPAGTVYGRLMREAQGLIEGPGKH